MKCTVRIEITLKLSLHDPEGVTAKSCLHDLGLKQVEEVRSGKVYYMKITGSSRDDILKIAELACTKLLANPVKDNYRIEIVKCEE